MRNCAFGNRLPSMPINGIEPPSPMRAAGFPKVAFDAVWIDFSSQGLSGGAFQPPPGLASYSAGKAAMASLVRSLAIELGPHGIRANGVHLGMVEGENIVGWIRDEAKRQGKSYEQMHREFATQRYPIQHIPTPEECAGAVLFLASDLARAITGQALMVNGGEYFR